MRSTRKPFVDRPARRRGRAARPAPDRRAARDGVRQRSRLARRHEQPVDAVYDRFGRAADARGHHRRACGHRLEQHVRQRFVERRHDRDSDAGEKRRHVGAQAREDDAIAHAELARQIGQHLPVVPLVRVRVADDDEPRVGKPAAQSTAASRNCSRPFRRFSRETTATIGASVGNAELGQEPIRVAGCRRSARGRRRWE